MAAQISRGNVVSPLGQEELVAVQKDGQVHRIDVATGEVTSLESIAKRVGPSSDNYLLADDDRIYLVANTIDSGNQWIGESLASIRMNGTVYAWSRQDNRLLWHKSIRHKI